MKFYSQSILALCVLLFALGERAQATHYRAGEILYELIGNYKYRASVITYSKVSGVSAQADRDYVEIYWGDGAMDTIWRVNGPVVGGVPNGEILANDIKKNIYVGEHTYPGAPPPPNRYYIISFFDMNRIDGIANIDGGNSVNIPFYVEDTLKFPTDLANIGFNSSPILLYPPIDYANLNDTFYHNPLAYDPDGDSLDFVLIPCLQQQGLNVPIYAFPDQYCQSNGQPNNLFKINQHTGELIWATPCQVGIFNIAILIREYRNGVNLGTLIRDMQIIVLNEPNNPPQIDEVADTCVRAGDQLIVPVRATDNNPSQIVTLSANGGPFFVTNSPATFTSTPGNPVTGTFNWQTECSHIQKQDYIVVFRAADNYSVPGFPNPTPAPLVDLETWQIHVIAPPPLNLTATANNQQVVLNWQNPYLCASSPDFRGFSVWRKIGCDPFTPEYCETGLAGRGYTKLTNANIFTYTYTDNATVTGQQYSYRIVAHFSKLSPNGLFQFDANESVPSDEVCVFMPVDVPVILNVDVQTTDVANGTIFVRWSKPLAGGNNLDTIQNPPPYRFDLYRGTGFNFANPQMIYSTTDAPSFSALVDTFYTDSGLDTKTTPWSYKVLFYSNFDTVGATSVASSVYLKVLSSDQSLVLSWQENVPWSNDSFGVYKLNKLTSLYEVIDTAYTHSYVDTGLINDSTYCYYIKAYGHYALNSLPRPLINNSQEECGVPVDTVAPCPPTLTVRNDCDLYNGQPWTAAQYINYLTWTNRQAPCADDINHYNIYYGNDSSGLTLLDSTANKADTTFQHVLNESLAGCYAVTAVDRVGNESSFSNVFCIDNCPYYVLPNVFTPNGDGKNDLYHPFKPYRFIAKIEMKIFNRWGEEVFSTEDPEIGWDGRDQKGKELNEGVYLYAGYYFEQRLNGLVKKPLSGQKKGGGFIHLMRGKQ
ncbi:MAG: gliding motility-associated C-terminal domain-containing protein [Chitinophagales bacterium]